MMQQDTPSLKKDRTASRRRLLRTAGLISLPLLVAGALGIAGGVGLFTFGYAKGWSYLSNDPQACANCHVMQGHFDSWLSSSHGKFATCNDCHLPHHAVKKWIVKADNGFFHSLAFTLQNFHEPIRIKPRNRRVTQGTCVYCHAETIHQMFPMGPAEVTEQNDIWCARCHSDVGHAGRVH